MRFSRTSALLLSFALIGPFTTLNAAAQKATLYTVTQPDFFGPAGVGAFDLPAAGNVAPVRSINGNNTRTNSARCVAAGHDGTLYVMQRENEINIFPSTASGNVAPARSFDLDLGTPFCPVIGSDGSVYIPDNEKNQIAVYGPSAHGMHPLDHTIAGANTKLDAPLSMAIGKDGSLYALNAKSITVYAKDARGDAAPTREIDWSDKNARALAVDDKGNIYVVSYSGKSGPTVNAFGPAAKGAAKPDHSWTVTEKSFEVEGTPVSIAVANGNLYIPYQNRILISPTVSDKAVQPKEIQGAKAGLAFTTTVAVTP